MELPYKELTAKIIGAGIEVHRELGPGSIESFYENALVKELQNRGLKASQISWFPGLLIPPWRDYFIGIAYAVK